jgi:membrane-bound metal-dependent hydrolase YbcI (DUF457 family)
VVVYSLYVLFFALVIKITLTLKREDRNRIIDLLFIGFTIYFTHVLPKEVIPYDRIAFSGFLIFAYGFTMLLYRKFKEGVAE